MFGVGVAQFIAWLLTVVIATFIIYWLWNAVLVRATTFARPIGFWEALGLSILIRLLFGPNVINERMIIEYVPNKVGRSLSARRK